MDQDKLKELLKLAKLEENPNLELFNELEKLNEYLDEIVTIFGRADINQLEKLKGEPGIDAYNPQKGVDYWTQEEVDAIKAEILADATPVKGLDYIDGIDGHSPILGKDYMTAKDIKKIKDEITPKKNIDYFDGKDAVATDGKDGESFTFKDFIESLRNLKGTEAQAFGRAIGALIDISHIKNAQSFIFNGKKYKTEELMRGGGSSSGSSTNFATNEVPTGTIDGLNTTFTLANTPTAGSVSLYQDGLLFTPTTDYSISGATITMVIAPHTNALLLANYRY